MKKKSTKAVLLMDFPEKCGECRLLYYCHTHEETVLYESKPTWCPIRALPDKECYSGHPNDPYGDGHVDGWNDCLDEIVGQ